MQNIENFYILSCNMGHGMPRVNCCFLACWVKISANNILKYFFLMFPENRVWHFLQIVFLAGKKDKNMINLSSAEKGNPAGTQPWNNVNSMLFQCCVSAG